MKRAIGLSIVAVLLLALAASNLLWSKAHVPLHKTQFCHAGEVIEVGSSAAAAHLGHGDCELPACDNNNVSFKEGACTCDLAPRDGAAGTPGCPADGSRF